MNLPETRYAKTADAIYIAYQTVGDGPIDIVWQFDWLGNVDTIWEYRPSAEWFRGLASFSRLILHDRRGTGASSRNVDPPNLETRVADLTAVLDAVGSARPVLGGALEGGAPNILFAATFPDRQRSARESSCDMTVLKHDEKHPQRPVRSRTRDHQDLLGWILSASTRSTRSCRTGSDT